LEKTVVEPSRAETIALCMICFEKYPNSIFDDCGHGGIVFCLFTGVCYSCAVEVFKKSRQCTLCRKKINKIIKIDQN